MLYQIKERENQLSWKLFMLALSIRTMVSSLIITIYMEALTFQLSLVLMPVLTFSAALVVIMQAQHQADLLTINAIMRCYTLAATLIQIHILIANIIIRVVPARIFQQAIVAV